MHSVTPNDPKAGYKEGQGHPKSHWMGYRDTGKDTGRDAVTPDTPRWAIGTQEGCCDPKSHPRWTTGTQDGCCDPKSPQMGYRNSGRML